VSWELVYTRQARKDARKLKGTPLAERAKALLELMREDPFTTPPPFEALVGDFKGSFSSISVEVMDALSPSAMFRFPDRAAWTI